MARRPNKGGASAPSAFIAALLAPLPKGEEVDETLFLREMDKEAAAVRCKHGAPPSANTFLLALADANVAFATQELFGAQITRVRLTKGDAAAKAMYAENDRHRANYRAAVEALALTPARTRWELEQKVRRIGKVWLTAEGHWYGRLRAGVATDEAWIAANVPTRQRRQA